MTVVLSDNILGLSVIVVLRFCYRYTTVGTRGKAVILKAVLNLKRCHIGQ